MCAMLPATRATQIQLMGGQPHKERSFSNTHTHTHTQMPYVTLEIGNRYSEDRVYAPPGTSWGMSAGCAAIQPTLLALHDSAGRPL